MIEKYQEYIDRVVAAAPPLSASQRDKIAALLNAPEPPLIGGQDEAWDDGFVALKEANRGKRN